MSKWKIGTIILLCLNIFLFFDWYREMKKNQPLRKEMASLQKTLERLEKEEELRLKTIWQKSFQLEYEKYLKDKEGKGFEGETMIIVSDKLLQSVSLPFLKEGQER
jgi:hypothetical protein